MLDGARAMAYETRLMVEPGCRGLHHLRAVLDCGDLFNNCSLRVSTLNDLNGDGYTYHRNNPNDLRDPARQIVSERSLVSSIGLCNVSAQ